MKTFYSLIILVILVYINVQSQEKQKVGELNQPKPVGKEELFINLNLCDSNRSKSSFVHGKIGNKDSVFELFYDSTYKGTIEELRNEVNAGTVERYFVIDKNGKVYEKIEIIQFEESFFEKYWIYILFVLIIALFIYYKINKEATTVSSDIQQE